MSELADYAAVAEIFGAATIVIGAVFAGFQFVEYRRRRKNQTAVELCRQFSQPELGRAISLIRRLPDGISLKDLHAMDSAYEESAQIVAMAFETMGLLVFKNVASFSMIQDLTGGLLLMMWRKLEIWIKTTRTEQQNPRFAEWVQWLAERMQECESEKQPAYRVHADWNRHRPGTAPRQRPGSEG